VPPASSLHAHRFVFTSSSRYSRRGKFTWSLASAVRGIARDEEHRSLARELAVDALRRLDKGGVVALGGIYSSPIPPIEYPWIYHERVVRSVANSTRQDARELLRDAALIPVVSRVHEYDLERANVALLDLKEDRVRGSAVLRVARG